MKEKYAMLKMTSIFNRVFPSTLKAVDGFLIILTNSRINLTKRNRNNSIIIISPKDTGMYPVRMVKIPAIPLNIKLE